MNGEAMLGSKTGVEIGIINTSQELWTDPGSMGTEQSVPVTLHTIHSPESGIMPETSDVQTAVFEGHLNLGETMHTAKD